MRADFFKEIVFDKEGYPLKANIDLEKALKAKDINPPQKAGLGFVRLANSKVGYKDDKKLVKTKAAANIKDAKLSKGGKAICRLFFLHHHMLV